MGDSSRSGSSEDDDDSYGPSLPPHLINKAPRIIGPTLPSNATAMLNQQSLASGTGANDDNVDYANDSESDDSDDDCGIGPFPPDDPRSLKQASANLSATFKSSQPQKREEWMLIPPKNKTIAEVVGLTPKNRKFLGRTPDEIQKPDDELDEEEPDFHEIAKKELEAKYAREEDEKMQEVMNKTAGAGSKETLLHLHRKKRKLKDAEDAAKGPKERRPFDRDQDLKVGGLSKEDQEKFIKKTSELGSRFHGGSKKFL